MERVDRPMGGELPEFFPASLFPEEKKETAAVQPAGFLRRVVAFLIDFFIIEILYLALLAAGFLGIRYSTGGEGLFLTEGGSLTPWVAPFIAAWFCLFLGYFTFFHAHGGQTPAKMLIRIKVVASGDAPLSPFRALVRSFGYFLSSFFFGFGFLMTIFNRKKRALHDLLTRTEVVLA